MTELKRIAIAVVEHNDQFLIGQRPPGVPLAGLWEFPGGKLLADESPEEGARRECREETGLEVQAVARYPEQIEEYAHGRVHLFFIACRPVDPHAVPISPFRWVARSELPQYEFPAGNRNLLDLLGEHRIQY